MTAIEFEKLKNDIANTKTEIARAEGRMSTLLSNLKDKYGVCNVKEAKEKMEELLTSINGMKDKQRTIWEQMDKIIKENNLG